MEGQTDEGEWRAWLLTPSLESSHEGVEVQTNSWGCRDEEFQELLDPNTRRMLVTGDSVVYGEGTAQHSILPYALRKVYEEHYDVVGCGQWGYTTLDSYMLYQQHLSKLTPAIVMHVFFLNDAECRQFCSQPAPAPQSANTQSTSWKRLQQFLDPWLAQKSRLWEVVSTNVDKALQAQEMQKTLKQTFSEESPGWQQSRRYLLKYRDTVESDGGQFILAIFPMMTKFQNYPLRFAHDTVNDFCASTGLTCIDLLPAFESAGGFPLSYHANLLNAHPNEKAFEVAALHIHRVLPNP